MSISRGAPNSGRFLFGLAALASGFITLAWHDYSEWPQLRYFVYTAAAAQIFGGAAILLRRSAKMGALTLTAVYFAYTALCLPPIVTSPRIYNSWGNFFEQFSLLSGAGIVFASLSAFWSHEMLQRIGRILLGICTASFTLEQAIYLGATANLVPKWVPPSPMFWAITTTVFFALAALALLVNRMALLAARLLTVMLLSFGLLVWVPLLLSDPRSHTNWDEIAETFAIAGATWILAELLAEHPPMERHSL